MSVAMPAALTALVSTPAVAARAKRDLLAELNVRPFINAAGTYTTRRDAGRSGAVLRVGDLVLDTARFEASSGGRLLDLTAKEFALLRYFMAHHRKIDALVLHPLTLRDADVVRCMVMHVSCCITMLSRW